MNSLKKNLKKEEIEAELARRELARRRLLDFVLFNFPAYKVNWHHKLLIEKLEQVERGDLKRLIVTMPPRMGKSEIVSVQFPAWAIGRNKDRNIIEASYSGDLAVDFGRQVRNLIAGEKYKQLFPTVTLAEDSQAKGKWNTNGRGAYNAVGVGGATTGKGADILLIDDPIKNRQDAESTVVRQSTWDWYTSTARTRLSPAGAIVVVMCMTGDTPVLMEDGTEKPLVDIRIGDRVATWDKGSLSSASVMNWSSRGNDRVYTITTSSGKMVRANERHPFLTYNNGNLLWTRLKELTTAQQIVTLRGNGGNGKARSVSSVRVPLYAVDSVLPTTTKRSGLMDIVRRLLTQWRTAFPVLNTDTELLRRVTLNLTRNKMVSVQFANILQETMFAPIGEGNSVSTTTTTPKKSEDYSATTAISPLGTQKMRRPLWLWQHISDFTLDSIVSIEEDGTEEVFDIQVERTENFIANGLVSHNTRWHDDDLVGRILRSENAKDWEVVSLPAIAIEDDKYRKRGESLWADHFTLEVLEETKRDIGSYDWSSLYQGQPLDSDSQEFRKEMIHYRSEEDLKDKRNNRYLTVDLAFSDKETSDDIGFCDNRVDSQNVWNLRAWKRKLNPKDFIDYLFVLHQENNYLQIGILDKHSQYTIVIKPFIEEECRKRNKFLPIVTMPTQDRSKELRIRALLPRYLNASVYHLEGACVDLEEQMLRFPKGVHDDCLDATSAMVDLAQPPNMDELQYLYRKTSAAGKTKNNAL